MIGHQNLHSHTYYDDGKCSAEEMVKGALDAGLTSIGICCHSPILTQKQAWCIRPKDVPAFQRDVYAAREKYRGIIDVYCGTELDIMSGVWADLSGFDYCLGAVHYMPLPMGENEFMYSEVDLARDDLAGVLDRIYHGDCDLAAEYFYSQYELVANNPRMEVVAHFDLLTKFDEMDVMPKDQLLFNQKSERYQAAALSAMKMLVGKHKIFEVNTGAVSRGYRETFYPSASLLKSLHKMNGRITLGADAHQPDHAGFQLDEAAKLAYDCGFREVWQLGHNGFKSVRIKDLLFL